MGFFDDPLARRELSGVSRRWPTFVWRSVVGVLLLWAVFYLWEQSAWAYQRGGYSAMAALSREVFEGCFVGSMILLPLMAVASAADLIPKEVRNGTLGLLFLTPLSPWRIVAGKWKAAMAQTLMLALSGAPVAAICVYLNGVGAFEILWALALPLATAGFAGALALFFSTLFRTPSMTVIASILALLAGIVGPVWIFRFDAQGGVEILASIHPVFAALVSAEPQAAWRSPDLALYAWISASAVALLCSALLVFAAAARLPGRLYATPGPSLASRFMARLDAFYESINVGRVRVFARSGEVWEGRALLWKELRTRTSGKLRHATRLALGLLLLGVLPFFADDWQMREWMGIFLWVFAGLLVLQAVVAGVGLFVGEREGRQWDVLLSTPLSSDHIVMAKLLGGAAALAPTAVVTLLYLGAICAVHPDGAEIAAVTVLPLGLFTVFAYLLSAAASLRARTHRGAFGMSMGLLLAILVGIPVFFGALDALPGWSIDDDDILGPTNPAWYLERASESLGHSWYYNDDIGYLFGFLFIYGLASLGLFGYMRLSFNRLAGRV